MQTSQAQQIKLVAEFRRHFGGGESGERPANSATNSEQARATGLNETHISNLWNGQEKWPQANSVAWRKLKTFLCAKNAGDKELPLSKFIDLPTTTTCLKVFAHCQALGEMGIIYGASGIGKTYAARHYAQSAGRVYLLSASPAGNTVYGILSEIAGALGISAGGSASKLENLVISKLRGAGGKRLLIVDEAQHLSQRVLDQIRCVYDKLQHGSAASAFGAVLTGNATILRAIQQREAAPQIMGRLSKQINLDSVADADVAAVLAAASPGAEENRALLARMLDVARGDGGLHRLIKVTRDGVLLAANAKAALTTEHINRALGARAIER